MSSGQSRRWWCHRVSVGGVLVSVCWWWRLRVRVGGLSFRVVLSEPAATFWWF